jgi:alkylhydroperoxidase/carboxymuconolactone decarboxylase family protein YurZ
VKLALAIGVGSEGATHSHTRRALEEGIEAAVPHQVALLAIATAGFPAAVKGLTWIDDIVEASQG